MRYSQATKDKAFELYVEGFSVAEIARHLSVSIATIRRWVTPSGQAYERRCREDPEIRARRLASQQKWAANPQNRERKKQYQDTVRQTPEWKERDRQRRQAPEYKRRRKEYNQTQERKEYQKEYNKKRQQSLSYKEYRREYLEEYRQNPKNQESTRLYHREYRRKKIQCDTAYRTRRLLRSRVANALRGKGSKSARTEELLGISVQELIQRWDDEYGLDWQTNNDFHIDHVRPCASFDLTSCEQQRLCFNYRNLQLLSAADNHSKGSRWDAEMESMWASRMRTLGWEGDLFLVYTACANAACLAKIEQDQAKGLI